MELAAPNMLERMPPANVSAEKSTLGSVLIDPNVYDDVALLVKPESFYDEANARIWEAAATIANKGHRIDVELLTDRLKKNGHYDLIGGLAYISELVHSVPHAASASYYAQIVADAAVRRGVILASTDAINDAYSSDDPKGILSRAEARLSAIHEHQSSLDVKPIGDVLHAAFARMDSQEPAGPSTGLIDVDKLISLRPGNVAILAARPSMGKTALALNIATNVARIETPVLFISLEMGSQEVAERLLSAEAQVYYHDLRAGNLSREDRRKLVEASSDIASMPLWIDDTPSRSVSEIAALARRQKRQKGLGLLVIDYLQFVVPDNYREPREQQVAGISRRIKSLARELSIPVLLLCQLNRQAETEEPKLSHLRESGSIEQDADVVMFIHRDKQGQSPSQDNIGKLLVKKQRNGECGRVTLTWQGHYQRFVNFCPPAAECASYTPAFEKWNDGNLQPGPQF